MHIFIEKNCYYKYITEKCSSVFNFFLNLQLSLRPAEAAQHIHYPTSLSLF